MSTIPITLTAGLGTGKPLVLPPGQYWNPIRGNERCVREAEGEIVPEANAERTYI